MPPRGSSLELARRDCAPAVARLTRIYGHVPPVVFVYQRSPEGEVTIGWAQRLVGRVQALRAGDPRPVILRAVVPGGRPLLAWFKARGWEGASLVAHARWFGLVQATQYELRGDVKEATLEAVRIMDSSLADVERLYSRGVSVTEIARLAGVERDQMRQAIERMRSLGFDMPHRKVYARRDQRV